MNIKEIVNDCEAYLPLSEGEALYLLNGEVIRGRDFCQPSNSCCLLTFEDEVTIDAANSEYPNVESYIQAAIELYNDRN